MKKIVATLALAVAAFGANAETFFYNGLLYGTVCRLGGYYTVYYAHQAQPVGTRCPVVNPYNGAFIGYGFVTAE